MSFIRRAVKKSFKRAKRVVRSKAFKWVVIAALVFFTAGVAAGGFAAFSGVATTGQFFVAVGQTIATGASAIAGGLGFKAASAKIGTYGGQAALSAGLTTTATSASGVALETLGSSYYAAGGGSIVGDVSAKGIARLAASSAAASGTTAAASGGTGIERVVSGLGKTSGNGGNGAIWKSVQTAATLMAQSKIAKADRKGPTFVAGGLSHGRSSGAGPQPFFVVGGPRGTNAETGRGTPPRAPNADQPTLAGQLARQPAQGSEGGPTPPQYQGSGLLAAEQGGGGQQPEDPQQGLVPEGFAQTEQSQQFNLLPEPDLNAPANEFFDPYRSTSILGQQRERRSLEDLIFGGLV